MSRAIVCDFCGQTRPELGYGIGPPLVYKLTHDSGGRWTDEKFDDKDFCSIKCVSDWAAANWKKEDDYEEDERA